MLWEKLENVSPTPFNFGLTDIRTEIKDAHVDSEVGALKNTSNTLQ